MPWRERSPVDLRVQFISEYQSELWSMTELAAQYGISRKTGYKWVARYERGGPTALVDHSRRPHQHPATTDAAVVKAVLVVRRRHPHWGAKKLLATVKREQPKTTWPGRSTVCDLLRRHGLIVPRPRRRRVPHGGHTLAPIGGPNATWTTDFKRRVPHGGPRLLLPVDVARRLQPLCAALRCAGDPRLRRDATLFRTRLCGLWPARAHSQ